ncbi:MAG: ABC transporter permease, partial [Chloroflexota bacterium]|nr:ABC transporter permease [Chloroflexota bacterium]
MRSEPTKLVTVPGALPAQVSQRTPIAPAQTRPLMALWRFARNKPLGAIGGIIVCILILTALFAQQIAPYAYDAGKGVDRLQGPSLRHLLGTDNLGRDMFSRIVYGARISVEVGFGAVLVGTGLAAILGIISGYFGGLFDLLFQRFIDAWIAFPPLVLLACLVTIMSTKKTSSTSSIVIVAIVIGLIVAGGSTRVVRSAVIGIRDMPYMESARCVGCNHTRIILRYVLPNVLAPIIILATVQLGGAILAESTLSFLGFGVKPPMPAWGSMLATSGQQF